MNYNELKQAASIFMHGELEHFDTYLKLVEIAIFSNAYEILDSDIAESKDVLIATEVSNELDQPIGLTKIKNMSLIYNGAPCNLSYRTVDTIIYDNTNSSPSEYTLFAGKILFNTILEVGQEIHIDCLKEFVGLSEANPENYVSINNPDIYLNGLIWQAKNEEDEYQDGAMKQQEFIASIKGANKKAYKKRYPNGVTIQMGYNYEQLDNLK